ncbi:MAG: Cna B-type domain-containing protein, partial [Oscillospiraceae bacterium]|nr:Cna B-type domain-containing protein [Oscillospiraceae bacterium]
MALRKKRILPFWLTVLALAALLPMRARALGPIDTGRPVTLTIQYACGGQAAPGVDFALYRAAEVSPSMKLTLTGDFADYPVSLEDRDADGWQALAATLEGYVRRDGLTPLDSGRTDRDGTLAFPSPGKTLTPGLYLVLGGQYASGNKIYTAEPFLVLLPAANDAGTQWHYDVTVTPKYTVRTETSPDDGVSRRVVKVWDDGDGGSSRPRSVTVDLLQNGRVYDTVTLSERNNWRHTWDDLDPNARWTVAERPVPGYTVTVSRAGATFLV